jgi:hypothetical protein
MWSLESRLLSFDRGKGDGGAAIWEATESPQIHDHKTRRDTTWNVFCMFVLLHLAIYLDGLKVAVH